MQKVKTTVKIVCNRNYSSPEHLLVSCGYHYYLKRGGGHSYIKPDEPHGRYEAHVRDENVIHLHYDVWIGSRGHITLPSSYTLQKEQERILQIMRKQIPETPIVNKKNQRRRERAQLGIPPQITAKKKDNTLSQKELQNIDWFKVKTSTKSGENALYPQSTTCTLAKKVLRWFQTKLTPWL